MLTFAIKMVVKENSQDSEGRLKRLRNEFEVYKKLEARMAGKIGTSVPQCYGLYESDSTLLLLLEYAGDKVHSWDEVSTEDS